MSALARLTLVALLTVPFMRPAVAAEMIVECFDRPECASQEALPDVHYKATVAEFLDREETGLGKPLAFVAFHELLNAISDQADAGIVLATMPDGERVVELLDEDYHRAAERIAERQRARLALWAAIEPLGDEGIVIDTYLTRRPGPDDMPAMLQITTTSGRDEPPTARIERTRFNFAPAFIGRTEAFDRPVVLRRSGVLRESPDADAPVVARVTAGDLATFVTMRDRWIMLEREDRRGWLRAGPGPSVVLPPRFVQADRNRINLRAGPGTDHRIVTTSDLEGRFRVLDQRYREGHGSWYRLKRDEGDAWVAAWLVDPVWTLPAIHFAAGLFRYQAGRWAEAEAEFRRFLDFPDGEPDNVNAAAANQYLALAAMRRDGGTERALAALDRSLTLTPFDPAAYRLRGLALLGMGEGRRAMADVSRALDLDPVAPANAGLVARLESLAPLLEPAARRDFDAITDLTARYSDARALAPEAEQR